MSKTADELFDELFRPRTEEEIKALKQKDLEINAKRAKDIEEFNEWYKQCTYNKLVLEKTRIIWD